MLPKTIILFASASALAVSLFFIFSGDYFTQTASLLPAPSSLNSSYSLSRASQKEQKTSLSSPRKTVEKNDTDNDDEDDERFERSLTENLISKTQLSSKSENLNEIKIENPPSNQNPVPKIDNNALLPKLFPKEPAIQYSPPLLQSIAVAIGGGSFGYYKKGDVIFSEIAWMGTDKSANNEWIELYNTTPKEISLQEFIIEKGDKVLLIGEERDEFTQHHVIPPYGYFLLERDETATTLNADKLYDGSLGNSGETLILKDGNGNEIDRVEMQQGWQAGKNENGYKPTMTLIQNSWKDGIPTPRAENREYKKKEEEILPPQQSYLPQSVVISEIAWMGSGESSTNEWIELYTNATSTINLSGWTLESENGSPIISLSGLLTPQEYFLLERTDDNSVSGITADLIYQGALENEGETLFLKDPQGNEIDRVGESGRVWYAGDNTTKKTMQKDNLALIGTQQNNWFTAQATPRSQNQRDPDPSPPPPAPPSPPQIPNYQFHNVLINEIAWMGTRASSQDEWLELKNATSTAITLENWKLEFSPNASSTPNFIITLETMDIIPSNGFFVLERNSTSTIQNIQGKTYSGSASQMANGGEYIVLRDGNGNIIDIVDGTDAWKMGTGSTKGSNSAKKSMERSSNNLSSWYTFNKEHSENQGETIIDRDGEEILGTPNCENSQELSTCAVD